MKVTELMIGDYVKFKGCIYIIEEISTKGWVHLIHPEAKVRINMTSDYIMHLLEPVQLTPEILKVNGFEQSVDDEDKYCFEDSSIIFKYNSKYLFSASINRSKGMLYICANYIHELQHALKVCGLNELADNLKLK
jgi:hypothetical protein